VLPFQERLTLYCGEIPVPLKDSLLVGFVALLAKVTVAEAVPVWLGAKDASAVTLWPALMVMGV